MGEKGWRLVKCMMYRDGGSLYAVLAQGDSYTSLLLPFARWEGEGPASRAVHGGLLVSAGRDPMAQERLASPEEERLWLACLASCDLELREMVELTRQIASDVDWAEESRRVCRKLVAILRERQAQR